MFTANEEAAARIKLYIDMVDNALKQLSGGRGFPKEVMEIIKLADSYLNDSRYYFGLRDYITSLSCISYAEGLLDALARLGYISIEWCRKKPLKVLVGGTFDLIHPGHIEFLREASRRGLVYAVIARDVNVERIKGRQPILNEEERLAIVSSIRYVYKALLGDKQDFMKPVERIRPDLIFLGPDQFMDDAYLLKELSRRGLRIKVERMKVRVGGQDYSTTRIINKIKERHD